MKKNRLFLEHITPAIQIKYSGLKPQQKFFLAALVMRATFSVIVSRKDFYNAFYQLFLYGDITPEDIKELTASGFIRIAGTPTHYAFLHSEIKDLTENYYR